MKISIDGNIGCGKSSILNRICQETRIPVFLEPIDDWKEWLDLFYNAPERWGLSFNLKVLLSFHQWKNNNFLSIYERSPISNRYVFSELQASQGKMNVQEIKLFEELYGILSWKPDVIIYIRTNPEICMQRMTKRGRECESSVQMPYLEAIHKKYETLFEREKAYIIDGNRSHDEVYADVLDIIKKCSK